ncbi:hypothetical protein OFB79_24330, partial [Escherichia coli]|nr:hypothetical protein [Escherichia coli]
IIQIKSIGNGAAYFINFNKLKSISDFSIKTNLIFRSTIRKRAANIIIELLLNLNNNSLFIN